MSLSRRATAVCVVLALASAGAQAWAARNRPGAKTSARNARLVPGQGIGLLVRLDPDGRGKLLRLVSAAPPRPGELRPPELTLARSAERPTGGDELVAEFHDREGRVVGTYGFPLRRIVFSDRSHPTRPGTFAGGVSPARTTTHMLRLPYPEKAAFLVLIRTRVLAPDGGASGDSASGPPVLDVTRSIGGKPMVFRQELLGGVPLRSRWRATRLEASPSAQSKAGLTFDRSTIELIGVKSDGQSDILGWPVVGTGSGATCGAGAPTMLHGNADPATALNIVIIGDGFTAADAGLFHGRADIAAQAFLGTPPLSDLASKINIYRVDTVSTDSHVDHCPEDCYGCPCGGCGCFQPPKCAYPCPPFEPDPKTTALEVRGDARELGVCTDFDVDYSRVFGATCPSIDPTLVDLWVVLVHCNRWGGGARPSERTAFVATWDETCPGFASYFPSVVLHEAAHVIAGLGEEYIGGARACESTGLCGECPSQYQFPNVATQDQVDAKTVWWKSLAAAATEKGPDGFLRHVENDVAVCYDEPPAGPAPLGLYWGAQFIQTGEDCDPAWEYLRGCGLSMACADLCCDPSCDARGRGFYRPTPSCAMRFPGQPFCRVCQCALWKAAATDTLTPLDEQPYCRPPADVTPPAAPTDPRRTDTRPG